MISLNITRVDLMGGVHMVHARLESVFSIYIHLYEARFRVRG